MSRSIGDVAAHEIGVSALPVVMQYRLSEADRLLVIATDGVWDMLDNSEVVDIAARASGDCKGDPAYAAAQVCQTARRAWEFKETRVDDITCLLVFLQHWPCRRSEAPGAASSAEALDRPVIPDSVDTSPQASQEAYQAYGRLEADASHKWMPSSPSAQARPSPSYSYPPLTRQTHDSAQEYSLGSPQKHSQQAHWQVAAASSQVSYIALSQDVYAGQGSLEQSDKAPLAPPHPTMQPPGPAQNVDASSKLPHRPPVPAPREVWASTYRPWMAPGRHPPQASATAGIHEGSMLVNLPARASRGTASAHRSRPRCTDHPSCVTLAYACMLSASQAKTTRGADGQPCVRIES